MSARDPMGTSDGGTSYSASIEKSDRLRMDQVERAKEYFFKALDSGIESLKCGTAFIRDIETYPSQYTGTQQSCDFAV